MNTMFEREEREEQPESEVSLSTGSLLAIFFGLVVVCGVFFGFGYSMGRHSADTKAAAIQAATAATEDPAASATNRPKPSAGEDLRSQTPVASPAVGPPQEGPAGAVVVDEPSHETQVPVETAVKAAAAVSRQSVIASTARLKPSVKMISAVAPATTPRMAAPGVVNSAKSSDKVAPPTQTMVQIAAVTRPEDAEALVAALKKRGYAVSVRTEPQDKLLRVQVGPFSNHADAMAMRQKLLSNGYNAILK